ncbi:hypothetical protein [Salinivibrio sp. MA351]|uniref:hypothetical protein n=1 Tax=Salinivibrio sp. MA351 TaxID=1909453 RepID=UPI0010550BF0|nr:hypothetical protein [Salinivibrio sp. MA351]
MDPITNLVVRDYERFRLQTAQYNHGGLYTDGENFYALIGDAADTRESPDSLIDTYNHYRTVTVPPAIIISELNESLEKIPTRGQLEIINHKGESFLYDEVTNYLNRYVPKKYQPFHFDYSFATQEFELITRTPLSLEDKEEIELTLSSIGFDGYKYIFSHNETIPDYPGKTTLQPNRKDNLILSASSFIKKQFTKPMLELYEEDEEFWLENRHSVFTGDNNLKREDYLPESFLGSETRCFIDASVFPRDNLRIYLSLYEIVIIALPFNMEPEQFYTMLRIEAFEFKELIKRKRLLFVIPQNLSRYSQRLLLEIINTRPESVIFSRRLTAASLEKIQEKSQLLGKTFSSDEQYQFLHLCYKSKNRWLEIIANSLAKQWEVGPQLIERDGAVSVYYMGASTLAVNTLKEREKDFTLELSSAAISLEYSLGLGAHHLPFDQPEYSEIKACEIISNFYNGFNAKKNFFCVNQR